MLKTITIQKKRHYVHKQIYTLLILLVLVASSYGQNKTALREDSIDESIIISNETAPEGHQLINQIYTPLHIKEFGSDPALQLKAFVSRIFQDQNGILWFGTNGDGVIRYDGDSLEYFSIDEGFGGIAVRGIVEDKEGNVWFGTSGGVTKYDGESFTNFTENDGLISNDVRSIVIDSNGMVWIGTLHGVSRFNGEVFTHFAIPEAEPEYDKCEHWWFQGATSTKTVHCIMEDSKGRIWFGTNGGAYIYDGKSLSNISEKDGLCNNSVNRILEDKDGSFWFATHHKGVCRLDGTSFTHIPIQEGVNGTNAWDIYEDNSGNIWFPIEGVGVHRYDGKTITDFFKKQSCVSHTMQCIFEDREGRLWFGGYLGLFRYDGKSFFSVTKKGPWE